MARVETSALIANISGKVNGSVFQRTQGGLIIRNQSGKINSNTLRSNSQRVAIAQVQGDWQTLTDSQRNLWQTYATYLNKKQHHSNSLIVNGHQLFININSVRWALKDYSPIFSPYLLTTPVLNPLPQPINIVSIVQTGFDMEVNLDRVVTVVSDMCILYLSRVLQASQQSAYQKLTLIKTETNTGTQLFAGNYYTQIYGRMAEVGEWLQTKIAIYNTDSENYSSYSVQRIQVT